MVDRQLHSRQPHRHPVGELGHVIGLGEGQAPEQLLPGRQAQTPGGVGKQRPVGWVDVGGDVPGAAHRHHRPDVVDVAVGEQDRHRLEPVLGEDLRDARLGVLTRVDDHALLPGAGRHHVAVGGK